MRILARGGAAIFKHGPTLNGARALALDARSVLGMAPILCPDRILRGEDQATATWARCCGMDAALPYRTAAIGGVLDALATTCLLAHLLALCEGTRSAHVVVAFVVITLTISATRSVYTASNGLEAVAIATVAFCRCCKHDASVAMPELAMSVAVVLDTRAPHVIPAKALALVLRWRPRLATGSSSHRCLTGSLLYMPDPPDHSRGGNLEVGTVGVLTPLGFVKLIRLVLLQLQQNAVPSTTVIRAASGCARKRHHDDEAHRETDEHACMALQGKGGHRKHPVVSMPSRYTEENSNLLRVL
eukprot:CAMPEP_0115195304 /NCGR_PEP_ID=MMETSP0270-20121206/14512_1 /TAXON_ID=71861 /ORGANISM="Scrippsiella trochoidea, Strain CCMP3099" /LENGTH=300 /DNA_ID=CAMNT_0002608623 /DNA_START=603 /DNA_END=1505 /DNA_ORIENTATION=-